MQDEELKVEATQVAVQESQPSKERSDNYRGQRKTRNNRGDRKPRDKKPEEESLYENKLVSIGRITKVVKGGRRLRFNALVVIGDRKGLVGFGTGKAKEVPDAIKKATKDAEKNLIKVPLYGATVPHTVSGKYGAGKVLIKPAVPGTGISAGGPVRAILELAGIEDVLAKSLGSSTPINMVRATIAGLKQLRSVQQVAEMRGIETRKVLK